MKTFICFLLVLPCVASAQSLEMDSTTEKLMYRRVVAVDSVTAGELYERARQWIVRAYVSADDVLQYENKEEGKLMGRGIWKEPVSLNNEKMEHVIIIECKDGRARVTFTDFVRETYDKTLGRERKNLENIKFMKKSVRESVAVHAARTGDGLEKSLKAAESKKKGDGW